MQNLTDIRNAPRGAIEPYTFSAAWWEATRKKRLLAQRCTKTGQLQFYPKPVSIATGRDGLEWIELDGKGAVYSYSIMRIGFGPLKGLQPYVVVIVRLDAGVDIVSNLVNCEEADLRIDMRVKPFWEPLDDGRHLLLFEPDREEHQGGQNA